MIAIFLRCQHMQPLLSEKKLVVKQTFKSLFNFFLYTNILTYTYPYPYLCYFLYAHSTKIYWALSLCLFTLIKITF